MNERQTQVLNRVLDGLGGKLTAAKWEAIGECSADTAPRDINDLLARGVLRRLESGGRSTRYGVRVVWVSRQQVAREKNWSPIPTPIPIPPIPESF